MVMPGDTVTFKVKLVGPIAMEEQMRFAIRACPSVALAKEGGWQDCGCGSCYEDRSITS